MRMKMIRKKYVAIAVILIIGISITLIGIPLILSVPLTWTINIGDNISYNISIEGWESNDSYSRMPTQLMIYNNQNVTAEITDIPELGFYLNGYDFQKQVVLPMKVEVFFANGSALPLELSSNVDHMISWSLLPTGSWNLIDWFYPDMASNVPGYHSYISSIDIESFHFGFFNYDFDSTAELRSDISFDTGIPSKISYYRNHGLDYAINVTLVQIWN